MLYKTVGDLISKAAVEKCGDRDFPVLSMTMRDGIIFQNDRFKKQIASIDKSTYNVVKRKQLVVSFPIDEGVLAIQDITEAGIVSPAYKIWNVDESKVVPKYLELFLRSPHSIQYYKAKLRGSTARRRSITDSDLLSMEIPQKTLEEQNRIIDSLNKAQSIITHRKQQLEKLDELVKARFVEMFGEVTETVPLSYYIKALTAGKSLAGEEECQNKVLKTGAATYDYFDPTQVKNLPVDYTPLPEHQIHDGDVIISRMNTAELVGAAAYIWKAPDHTYLPDRLWRAEIKDGVNPIFAWQIIIQPTTKEAIRQIAGGTSGSMKNISKTGLLGVNVIKVSIDQQNQFAAFVEQTDKSKVIADQSIQNIKQTGC